MLAVVAASCGGSNSPVVQITGEPITDAVRAAGQEGDGREPDGSVGIWEETLNLVENGGFETDARGWTADPADALQRVTDNAKFGEASARVVATPDETVRARARNVSGTRIAVDGGLPYTASVWARADGGSPQVAVGVRWFDVDGGVLSEEFAEAAPARDAWDRQTLTVSSPPEAWEADVLVAVTGGTLLFDGVQFEQQPLATPYVETDGFKGVREEAQVSFDADLLDEQQGWVAARIRMGWDSSRGPLEGRGFPRVLEWGDGGTDRISVFYSEPNGVFGLHRRTNDEPEEAVQRVPFTEGTVVTVVATWTPDILAISIDGEPFVSVETDTPAPDLSRFARVYIGGPKGDADSDFFWLAAGRGVLSDDEAAVLQALPDDAGEVELPEAAEIAVFWD